jgi:hypothetical protein
VNDFQRDDEWQRQQRDAILCPNFYKKYATDGRYVVIDKGALATILQKRYAVDTIIQGKNGSAIFIEEKIVRWPGYPYSKFFLETKSCTVPGHESPGWMFYGQADYLLYCFQCDNDDLDCWLVDFPKLHEWFWPRENTFLYSQLQNTINKTAGRLVPVKDVHRSVPAYRYRVKAKPAQQLSWNEMWSRPFDYPERI